MKNQLLLFGAMICMAINSSATVHTISVGGTSGISFVPSSLTVHPGDTVMWTWGNGTHTTTSTTIPTGATAWNQNINSTPPNTSFQYVPTVLGTYNYQCTFHVSMGMIGSFTVVSATGIASVNKPAGFGFYPNPASENVHIQFQNASRTEIVTLTDMSGKEVIRKAFSAIAETYLNLADIPDGTYILHVQENKKNSTQELVVHH